MSVFSFIRRQWKDIPKTVYFNLKVLGFKEGIHFPILIDHRVKLGEIHKRCVEVPKNAQMFGIKIGIQTVEGVSSERAGYIMIGSKAKVIFKGRATISRGITIRTTKGTICFGDNFYCNSNLSIICSDSVRFGDDVLLGWDINVRDCDGHTVFVKGKKTEGVKPVSIMDHVWIGSYVDILKGVTIQEGSIIAYRSCVLHSFDEKNIMIGGYPAKKLKEGVEWHA